MAQEIVGSGQHFGPIACREQLQEPVDGFLGTPCFSIAATRDTSSSKEQDDIRR